MLLKTGGSSPYFDELRRRREEERNRAFAELEQDRQREQAIADMEEQRRYEEGREAARWARQDQQDADERTAAAEKERRSQQERAWADSAKGGLTKVAAGGTYRFTTNELPPDLAAILNDPDLPEEQVELSYNPKTDDVTYKLYGKGEDGQSGAVLKSYTAKGGSTFFKNLGLTTGYKEPDKVTATTTTETKPEGGGWFIVPTAYPADSTDGKGKIIHRKGDKGPSKLMFLTPKEQKAYQGITPVAAGTKEKFDERMESRASDVATIFKGGNVKVKGDDDITGDEQTDLFTSFAKLMTTELQNHADALGVANFDVDAGTIHTATRKVLSKLDSRYGHLFGRTVKLEDGTRLTYKEYLLRQLDSAYPIK